MKELMDIKRWGQSKWRMPLIVAVLAVVILVSFHRNKNAAILSKKRNKV